VLNSEEDAMLTRLTAAAALVLFGLTGAAYAQMDNTYMARDTVAPYDQQAMPEHYYRGGHHQVAITDEYGFKYDAQGDRLDASGHIIAPPVTPPGVSAIQNGPGSR
jgi:hypothetical protein